MKTNIYNDGVNHIPPHVQKRLDTQPPLRKGSGRHQDISWVSGQLTAERWSDEAIFRLIRNRYADQRDKSDKEIRDLIVGARKLGFEPVGGGRAAYTQRQSSRYTQPEKPKVEPVSIDPADIPADLPEIEQPTLWQTIETLFKPGDIVCLGYKGGYTDDDSPEWSRVSVPFEKLMEFAKDPEWFVSVGNVREFGGFFVPNPFKTDENRKTNNVAEFRYVMFESDKLSKQKQLAIYRASKLPIVTMVDSGGDSLHALVRVDADSLEQFEERAAIAKARLGPGFDNTQDPVRFTRLPNVERREKGSFQKLISWEMGAASWVEWEESIQPRREMTGGSIIDYANAPIDHSSTLLGDRYLCRGGGMFIVAPSGQGKSTLAGQLGGEWGFGGAPIGLSAAKPLRVLIIQAEDDAGDLTEMSKWIQDAGFSPEKLSLIGKNTHIETVNDVVGDRFIEVLDDLCGQWKPDIVIINPYTSYLGAEPKDDAAANRFLREGLTPLLVRHNCAAVIFHHTPKTQFNPSVDFTTTDFMYRGAGCSSMTNWTRAYLVFEPVNDSGLFRFVAAKRGKRIGWGTTVRFYQWSSTPGVIKWEKADPDEVEKVTSKKSKTKQQPSDEKLLSVFSLVDPISQTTAVAKMVEFGASRQHSRDAVVRFEENERISAVLDSAQKAQKRGKPAVKYLRITINSTSTGDKGYLMPNGTNSWH